ncbi:MAG: MMPL family transporter [Thermodesulfobacteriota bacterium]
MISSRLVMLGVKHRLPAFLFLAALTCAAGLGLPKLRVDTGSGSLIPDGAPDRAAYNRFSREFGSDHRIMIYVRDKELWSAAKLAALEEMHYALEALFFVDRVDDLFNARTVRSVGGKIDSRLILPAVPKEPSEIHQARTQALSDPLIAGTLLSRDGNGTAIVLSMRDEKEGETLSGRRVEEALERVLAPARSAFQEVLHVGPPRFSAGMKDVLLEDLRTLGPLSAAILACAVVLFLRSVFAAVLVLLTAGLSIIWTLGMMGWTGIPLNVLCSMLPSLVLVVGSAGDVHMIASYFRGLSQAQAGHRLTAVQFMMQHQGVTLILTVLTITLAFASTVFSSIAVIRDFALAATFAMVAKGFVTLLLVPMVLSVMGPRGTTLFQDHGAGGLPGLLVRMFAFAKSRLPRSLLVATAILCVFFVYQLSKLYVTDDPLSYLKQDHPIVRDTLRIHQDLPGVKTFFITIESDRDKAFQQPRNLEKLVTVQNFLEKQGIFDRSLSLADLLSLVNREFHGGDPEYYRIPERRELVAQYLLFFHRRDLERYVSHDFRRANIVVRHHVADSRTLNRHIQELREMLSSVARGEMTATVVGEDLMINAAAEGLLSDQVQSLAVLLCVIFLVMSAMFTSFKGGLISLLPNLIPVILMFGLMGLLGIPLNPGTVMVAVIAVGIAIDGTLHLISRYNDLCRRTSNYEEAVQATIREEATALVATYFALAVGFGILLLSGFDLIAQFGALSAVTMIFALFANILITPIILSQTRLVGLNQIWSLSVHKEILQKSPLFQGMSDYQMRKTILISELKEFQEGDLLVEQGTFGRSMFVILTGRVEVARRTEGRVQRIALLGPGQVFGEVGYINEIERTADVRALTHVEALRFDYRKLRKDLKYFPHLVANLNFNISFILGERLAGVMGAFPLPQEKGESPPSPPDRAPEKAG